MLQSLFLDVFSGSHGHSVHYMTMKTILKQRNQLCPGGSFQTNWLTEESLALVQNYFDRKIHITNADQFFYHLHRTCTIANSPSCVCYKFMANIMPDDLLVLHLDDKNITVTGFPFKKLLLFSGTPSITKRLSCFTFHPADKQSLLMYEMLAWWMTASWHNFLS